MACLLRRWLVVAALALLASIAWDVSAGAQTSDPEREVVELFTRSGCPHCADARAFLAELERARPGLTVVVQRVDDDARALSRLREVAKQGHVQTPGVPAFWVRGRLVVGFDGPDTTGRQLVALLEGDTRDAEAGSACAPEATAPCEDVDAVDTGLFGTLRASELGLPLFTLLLGLLDGFNPCAMWVLLFLLSMLVNFRDRRKMALVAGTFVVVSGLAYFAFMAAWLNVFLLVGVSKAVQTALGLVALLVGAIHVKDFVAFKQGISLSIPESAKPGIYARTRAVLRADSMLASMAGVAVLAAMVNVIELLCTAGFPAVYTAVLASRELSPAAHYGYLALYNVAYVLDDGLMVTLAVVTLSKQKLTEHAGRVLKLVSGLVMIALACGLLFFPDLLR